MLQRKNRIAELFCLVLLASFGILMIVCGNVISQNRVAAQKQVAHVPAKTIYKTILKSDSATDVIGFELHDGGGYSDGEIVHPLFNVVVKSLDPGTDDYKALCKDIVADIIRTYGDEHAVVNIYDSSEAYELSRSNEQGIRILNEEEATYASNHLVAVYSFSDEYDDEHYHFTFYPDADHMQAEQTFYSSI